jgi:hypothetical protein
VMMYDKVWTGVRLFSELASHLEKEEDLSANSLNR